MIVKNITRNTIITKDLKVVSSFSDRLLGLLSKQNPRSLLLSTRFGIHTFGLDQPIDVIVTDRSFKVRILKTINPNKIFIYNPKYKLILELPSWSIAKSKTEIGDIVKIILIDNTGKSRQYLTSCQVNAKL